jgi:hypothetical protein
MARRFGGTYSINQAETHRLPTDSAALLFGGFVGSEDGGDIPKRLYLFELLSVKARGA